VIPSFAAPGDTKP